MVPEFEARRRAVEEAGVGVVVVPPPGREVVG